MSREILISYADRLLKIINTPKTDLDELGALLSPDLQTPLTYPNTSSGYEGIKSLITKLHGSLTSFALTVISSAVDEKESRVVYFVKSAGIQTGYIYLRLLGAYTVGNGTVSLELVNRLIISDFL